MDLPVTGAGAPIVHWNRPAGRAESTCGCWPGATGRPPAPRPDSLRASRALLPPTGCEHRGHAGPRRPAPHAGKAYSARTLPLPLRVVLVPPPALAARTGRADANVADRPIERNRLAARNRCGRFPASPGGGMIRTAVSRQQVEQTARASASVRRPRTSATTLDCAQARVNRGGGLGCQCAADDSRALRFGSLHPLARLDDEAGGVRAESGRAIRRDKAPFEIADEDDVQDLSVEALAEEHEQLVDAPFARVETLSATRLQQLFEEEPR